MTFTIHRNPDPPRVIRMGGAPEKLQPPPMESKQGRNKMVDDKKFSDETGVKKISQEPADKQGPVGTSAQPPAPKPDVEIKIGGGQEDKADA